MLIAIPAFRYQGEDLSKVTFFAKRLFQHVNTLPIKDLDGLIARYFENSFFKFCQLTRKCTQAVDSLTILADDAQLLCRSAYWLCSNDMATGSELLLGIDPIVCDLTEFGNQNLISLNADPASPLRSVYQLAHQKAI
ncbi:MAG: hypothetical protein V3T17_02870 [Pseudomonadales bacterium]